MTTMNRRARVLAALRGQPVDRVPISFWLHNFATENSARGLADETLRLEREFGWDFLKPQSRAQGFAEMWGLTYRPSGERAVPYTVTRTPLAAGADFARLQPAEQHETAGAALAEAAWAPAPERLERHPRVDAAEDALTAQESLGRHSDDGERAAVDAHRAANDGGVRAEARPP